MTTNTSLPLPIQRRLQLMAALNVQLTLSGEREHLPINYYNVMKYKTLIHLYTEYHQLSLSKEIKLITTALHDFRVEIRYISYLLDNLLEIIKELCC